MLRGILPKEVAFYDYFDKLAEINTRISVELLNMVQGKTDMNKTSLEIKQLERDSEKITRTCIDLLHRTFITPMDRDEIFQLVKGLDNFADDINSAAFRLAHYDLNDIRPEAIEFAHIIKSCSDEIETAVKSLKIIKHNNHIRENCIKIHELEYRSDEILRNAVAELFKTNDIILLMKWKEIFERMEKAVDRLERVANTIESILIENS